jgi:pimeloyl-ACP methyl ester carboxylesterase
MPYAKAGDGVRIAYQTHGNGIPLILLAGQVDNHHWWDGVREDFHPAYRTITFDYRGIGDSDKPDTPYSTMGFADDVIAVLDDLGIARPSNNGSSGGSV